MKNLQSFEDFLNESLSVGAKAKAADVKKLIELAKKDPEEFIEEFAQTYGSACEIWMGEADVNKLAKLYASGNYEFMTLGGDDSDGADDSKILLYSRKGWLMFADEQNGDSYDAILYKKKK